MDCRAPTRSFLLAMLGAGALVLFSLRTLLLTAPGDAYDWHHFFHYYDWIRISLLRWHVLPLYMPDALHTTNFLANPQSPLGPLVGLLLFIPTALYIKLLIFLYATCGVLGMYALLRDQGVEPEVAFLAGTIFSFNGFFASHLGVGHHCFFGVYALPALLWLFRRALTGSVGSLWAGAALNATVVFDGSHHAFLWQNTFLVLYTLGVCLEQRSAARLRPALLFFAASIGLAAVKLLPMLSEFADYDPIERIPALRPAAALFALVGRGQNLETARPDLLFAFGSGWWEYAFYVGALGLAFIVGGAVVVLNERRSWPWLVPGGFFLLLALDLSAVLGRFQLWSLVSALPLWRSQRCPARYLVVALFSFVVLAALGLQRLLDRTSTGRGHRLARAAVAALTIAVALDLAKENRPWQGVGQGRVVLSHEHFPLLSLAGRARGASVRLVEFEPHRFVVAAEASRGATLFLPLEPAERARRWRITGGEPTEFEDQLAVRVAPGESKLVFVFDPPWLRLGLAISGATALAGALACGRAFLRRKAPHAHSRRGGTSSIRDECAAREKR